MPRSSGVRARALETRFPLSQFPITVIPSRAPLTRSRRITYRLAVNCVPDRDGRGLKSPRRVCLQRRQRVPRLSATSHAHPLLCPWRENLAVQNGIQFQATGMRSAGRCKQARSQHLYVHALCLYRLRRRLQYCNTAAHQAGNLRLRLDHCSRPADTGYIHVHYACLISSEDGRLPRSRVSSPPRSLSGERYTSTARGTPMRSFRTLLSSTPEGKFPWRWMLPRPGLQPGQAAECSWRRGVLRAAAEILGRAPSQAALTANQPASQRGRMGTDWRQLSGPRRKFSPVAVAASMRKAWSAVSGSGAVL